MVAVSNTPYTVAIENITEFENNHQRAQVQHGARVYDISWDSANERVVAYYTEEDQPLWFEIRCDGTVTQDITLYNVLTAFGCASEDTVPVLSFPLDHGFAIENYLVTPISAEFLMQMSIEPVDNHNEDDPSPTSSENETVEMDEDDDNPVIELFD